MTTSAEHQPRRKPFAIGACTAFLTVVAVSVGAAILNATVEPDNLDIWFTGMIAADALGALAGLLLLIPRNPVRRVGLGVIAGTACAVALQVTYFGAAMSNSG
jgi:hypothetical protein